MLGNKPLFLEKKSYPLVALASLPEEWQNLQSVVPNGWTQCSKYTLNGLGSALIN
jgi:hypothetical protein